MFFLTKNSLGQSVVEYIFMLAVTSLMVIAIGRRFKEAIIGDGECPNGTLYCKIFETISGPGALSGNFRYFTLRR